MAVKHKRRSGTGPGYRANPSKKARKQNLATAVSNFEPKTEHEAEPARPGSTAVTWLFTPRDSWFFGTGLPFLAGETGWQHSRFPPSPLTMQGAVRGILLQWHGVDFAQFNAGRCSVCDCPADQCPVTRAVGRADDPDSSELSLYGPFVADAQTGEVLYPVPLDLVEAREEQKDDKPVLVRLQPGEKPVLTDLGEHPLPAAPPAYRVISTSEEMLMPAPLFQDYLLGKIPTPNQLVRVRPRKGDRVPAAVMEELHVGIARNHQSRTTQEHMLYTSRHLRLRPEYALLERIEGLPAAISGLGSSEKLLVRLGGESRLSFLESRQTGFRDQRQRIAREIDRGKADGVLRFRLILVQPALFRNGWLPDGLDPSTWRGELRAEEPGNGGSRGIPVRLVSACVGRAVLFGGWDTVKKQPKPTVACVPAGSVYFFETLTTADTDRSATETEGTDTSATEGAAKQITAKQVTAEQIVEALHDRKIGRQTRAGFGHVCVGCGW